MSALRRTYSPGDAGIYTHVGAYPQRASSDMPYTLCRRKYYFESHACGRENKMNKIPTGV